MQAFACCVVMVKLPPNQYYLWTLSTQRNQTQRAFVGLATNLPNSKVTMCLAKRMCLTLIPTRSGLGDRSEFELPFRLLWRLRQ